MDKKTGGPAFPGKEVSRKYVVSDGPLGMGREAYEYREVPGMTLRDWFAGQALVGLASRYLDLEGQTEEACIRSTASIAGKMADAMLSERDK